MVFLLFSRYKYFYLKLIIIIRKIKLIITSHVQKIYVLSTKLAHNYNYEP